MQLKQSITAAGTCPCNCCAEWQVARTVSGDVTGKSEKGAQNIRVGSNIGSNMIGGKADSTQTGLRQSRLGFQG